MVLNIKKSPTENKVPFESQVSILKALTHPARIAILYILRDGEHCVCHLSAYLGFRQAYISQQLSVLREAGLIQDRRDGWNIYYRVVNPLIFEVLDAVEVMTDEQISFPPTSQSNCSCPHCSPKDETAG
ncbi:MAG: metalloregulator ArsR/SmtB family transcription factor [Anaerolineaceae bacterium]